MNAGDWKRRGTFYGNENVPSRIRRRRFRDDTVFARELLALSDGATIAWVLASLFGSDVEGVRWQWAVTRMLRHGAIRSGELLDDREPRHSEATERAVLRWLVRILSELRRKGSRILAEGPEVIEGRDCRFVEQVNPEDGEWTERRVYVPARSSSGLAARHHRSPRTIRRWKRIARIAHVLKSSQPDHDASDAMRPRNGDWAYCQYFPATELPPLTLRRLRIWWGELSETGERTRERRKAPKAVSSPAPKPKAHAPPELERLREPPGLATLADEAARVLAQLRARQTEA